MYFRCLSLIFIAILPCMAAEQRALRVCADPNNMPFSNDQGEGFENKLAEMIAGKLGAKLEYTWWSEANHSSETHWIRDAAIWLCAACDARIDHRDYPLLPLDVCLCVAP